MESTRSFGHWLKHQRRVRDLTQEELARRAACAVVTLQKLEAAERRCSPAMAEALARALEIPAAQQEAFVRFARGELAQMALFAAPNNLPAPMTPLIGRNAEVAALCNQLHREGVRLLTLYGPPGIGKTRLGLKVAADLLDWFEDGVYFVPLAPLTDPAQVAPSIGQTLRVSEFENRAPTERLSDHLRFQHMLLVLDNFEQVLDARSDVVTLLARCPSLKILVTSRVALCVRAERRFAVPPLQTPDPAELPPLNQVLAYGAVALFADRARAVCPDFEVTTANAPAVAQICRRLDGLPLAIELIAARTQILSPEQIVARLHGRFLLQSDGLSDADDRQRTLQQAIAWSYNLLSPAEQALLAQLSVFVGGWTLQAAEAVCILEAAAGEVLADCLSSLVNKSLVVADVGGEEPRFGLLEMVRQYAMERLSASGQMEAVQRRHAEYCVACRAHYPRPLSHSPEMFDQLERDHDNLRTALEWLADRGEVRLACRLGVDLSMMWSVRGRYLSEGRRLLERVLALLRPDLPEPILQAEIYDCAGVLAMLQTDIDTASAYLTRAVACARESGDPAHIARTLHSLSGIELCRDENSAAAALLEECLPMARALGDPWLIAMSLAHLGTVRLRSGDIEGASAALDEGIAILTSAGDKSFLPLLLASAADVAEHRGDHLAAASSYRTSLALAYEVGDRRIVAASLEGLAAHAARCGQPQQGARLLGTAEALRTSIGVPVGPAAETEYAQKLACVRAMLDGRLFESAWSEGRNWRLDAAIAAALDLASM